MTLTLTSNKKENIRDIAAVLLLKQSCSIRTLASFLGNIVSSFEAVPNGKLYYRSIEQQKIEALKISKGNFDINIKKLSSASLSEIKWWHNHTMHANAMLSIKPTPDIDYVIHNDASESGWRAHHDINNTGGRWSDDEIHYHINVLELLAIELALKAFLKDSNKKHARIFSDNTTAVTYINKQDGIKSVSCDEIAKKIWEFCIHNNTHISAAHIPGKHNILANLASRKFQDSAEWMLEPKIFDYVIRQFGRPDIDTFSSRLTKQITVYASWLPDPESSFIDAFTINWNNIFTYTFPPPFSIIWRMLQKIQEE